jgi:hypothetical protein
MTMSLPNPSAPGGLQHYVSGRIHLVDLAGSERLSKTCMADPDMVKEAGSINKSLGALGEVISKLSARHRADHIPFRNSKLTRLLQESLSSSSSFTVMLATVSPADCHLDETLQTLQYASRAKAIANKTCPGARACRALKVCLLEAKALRAEIAALRSAAKMDAERGLAVTVEQQRCLTNKEDALMRVLAKADGERAAVKRGWGGEDANGSRLAEMRHITLRRMKVADILVHVLGSSGAHGSKDTNVDEVRTREALLVTSSREFESARANVTKYRDALMRGLQALKDGRPTEEACLDSAAGLLRCTLPLLLIYFIRTPSLCYLN